jgi:hypothetical protein
MGGSVGEYWISYCHPTRFMGSPTGKLILVIECGVWVFRNFRFFFHPWKHANHQEGVPPRTHARTLSLVLVGLTSNVYLQGWASPLPGRDRFLRRRLAAAGEQRYMPACLASSL